MSPPTLMPPLASCHWHWAVAVLVASTIAACEGDGGPPGADLDAAVDEGDGAPPCGGDFVEVEKLSISDGPAQSFFGVSVAVSGDTAAIGASELYWNGTGSVYVYQRGLDAGGRVRWQQVQVLTSETGSSGDGFGKSVAIDGDVIVVGAPGRMAAGLMQAGEAYVFERLERQGRFELVQTLRSESPDSLDGFGRTVAVDGDRIGVGAPKGNGLVQGTGVVELFERDLGGPRTWGRRAHLSPPGGGIVWDAFGGSLALRDDVLAVGSVGCDIAGDDQNLDEGCAYLFRRDHGGPDMWGFVKRLSAPEPRPQESFGWSVAIDESAVKVAARDRRRDVGRNAGEVFTFDLGTEIADVPGLAPSPAQGFDRFGSSLSLAGDILLVGADQELEQADDAPGRAFVFERERATLSWNQTAILMGSDLSNQDLFGHAAALDGNVALVGAFRQDDDGRVDVGAAYVFERSCD